MEIKFLVYNPDRNGRRYSEDFVEGGRKIPEIGAEYLSSRGTFTVCDVIPESREGMPIVKLRRVG